MSDTVEPLTDDAWDAVGEPVYEVPEVDWRHDPTLHSLPDNESATGFVAPNGAPEGREVATVVLLNGHPTAVPMTRAEAIEAGHTVLDVDIAGGNDSLESENVPTAAAPHPVLHSGRPVLRIVSSTDTDRDRMNDWLRTVSRSRGARAVGPPPIRRLTVVRSELGTRQELQELPPATLFQPVASSVVHVVAAPPRLDPLSGEVRVPRPSMPAESPTPTVAAPDLAPRIVETQRPPITTEMVVLRANLLTNAPVVIAARALTKSAKRRAESKELFRAVSIDFHAGEFVVVTGPSGSGKTTLLSCLSGSVRPDAGDVLIDGHELGSLTESDSARLRASMMGFTSTAPGLVSILTVVENVELPLLVAGWNPADARSEAMSALALLRVPELASAFPESLSTGERVCVSIARGLVGDPKILWADDPTGGLDPETADHVAHVFRQVSDDGLTVVVASHDVALLRHAHRIMELREGTFRELPRRKVLEACQHRLL